jgi:hypothetical protein
MKHSSNAPRGFRVPDPMRMKLETGKTGPPRIRHSRFRLYFPVSARRTMSSTLCEGSRFAQAS